MKAGNDLKTKQVGLDSSGVGNGWATARFGSNIKTCRTRNRNVRTTNSQTKPDQLEVNFLNLFTFYLDYCILLQMDEKRNANVAAGGRVATQILLNGKAECWKIRR